MRGTGEAQSDADFWRSKVGWLGVWTRRDRRVTWLPTSVELLGVSLLEQVTEHLPFS